MDSQPSEENPPTSVDHAQQKTGPNNGNGGGNTKGGSGNAKPKKEGKRVLQWSWSDAAVVRCLYDVIIDFLLRLQYIRSLQILTKKQWVQSSTRRVR